MIKSSTFSSTQTVVKVKEVTWPSGSDIGLGIERCGFESTFGQ